jgi:HEAT repeat protein
MGTVDELIRELETGTRKQRRQAAAQLGQLGDPKAVPALLQKLDDFDEDRFVRTAAAIALGKLADLNAVPALIRAYRRFQEDELVQSAFLDAIGEILGRTSPDDGNSREIFSRAVDTLIEAVQDDSTTDRVRTAAVEALDKTRDPKAIPVLAEQLREDKLESIAKAAARALRHFDDPQVIQALTEVAANKNIDEKLREAAVQSLGDIGSPNAVDTLISILEDSSDEDTVRSDAALALGRIGDTKAIEPLIRTLENESDDSALSLRAAIAESLSAFRDPRVIDALITTLGDYYYSSHAAAESLKKLRDRRAVEPLISVLDDGTKKTHEREFAAQILGVIADPRAIPALVNALRDNNEDARKSLQSFVLTHPDAILRIPPDDRHLIGRVVQDSEREELLEELCGESLIEDY